MGGAVTRLGRARGTVIALLGSALAAGTTCATAASLPIGASIVSGAADSTTGAAESMSSPVRDAPVASITSPAVSRLHLSGEKWVVPNLQRSETGIAWSFTPKVTLELNYERSAMPPTMPHDHDDGFLTRLKLGF